MIATARRGRRRAEPQGARRMWFVAAVMMLMCFWVGMSIYFLDDSLLHPTLPDFVTSSPGRHTHRGAGGASPTGPARATDAEGGNGDGDEWERAIDDDEDDDDDDDEWIRAVEEVEAPHDEHAHVWHGPVATGDEVMAGSFTMPSPAIVVIAYNRPKYLRSTVDSLLALPEVDEFSLYISQDGDHAETADVARSFPMFQLRQHKRVARLGPDQKGSAWLAQHYKNCLDWLFLERGHSHVVIVEDDMVFAPDFLRYFEQTAVLLEADPTLYCVSSWNDNGFRWLGGSNRRLFRNSFFPGLGWMLKKELWLELGPSWPLDHWDHWMRLSVNHKGRDCVCPEVSRNFNIGEFGVHSQTAEYNKYFRNIVMNEDAHVDFGDLHYMVAGPYDRAMRTLVLRSTPLTNWYSDKTYASDRGTEQQAAAGFGNTRGSMLTDRRGFASVPKDRGQTYLIAYERQQFPLLARRFGIWDAPRAMHHRTQVLFYEGNTFVLADARLSPYVPDEFAIAQDAAMVLLPGLQGESCTKLCSRKGRRCDESQFDFFVLSCEALAEHFPCERGCHFQMGPDIPNYVSDATNVEHYQRCLVTDAFPKCSAAHRSTRRLCPCV